MGCCFFTSMKHKYYTRRNEKRKTRNLYIFNYMGQKGFVVLFYCTHQPVATTRWTDVWYTHFFYFFVGDVDSSELVDLLSQVSWSIGRVWKGFRGCFFPICASEFLSFTLPGKETFCFLLLLNAASWGRESLCRSFVGSHDLNTNDKRLSPRKWPCSLMPTLDFKVPLNFFIFFKPGLLSPWATRCYGFIRDLPPITSLIAGVKRKALQHRCVRH